MESYSRRFKSRKIRSSAERTAPPRPAHIHPGDVSSFLIQQGEGEVDGDQQHDGVVVMELVVLRQGFAKRYGGGGVGEGKGLCQGKGLGLLAALPLSNSSSSSVVLGEALAENHELLHHHGVVLLEFSLNFSSPLAGSRRRRRPRAVRVLNAEASSVRRLIGSSAI